MCEHVLVCFIVSLWFLVLVLVLELFSSITQSTWTRPSASRARASALRLAAPSASTWGQVILFVFLWGSFKSRVRSRDLVFFLWEWTVGCLDFNNVQWWYALEPRQEAAPPVLLAHPPFHQAISLLCSDWKIKKLTMDVSLSVSSLRSTTLEALKALSKILEELALKAFS